MLDLAAAERGLRNLWSLTLGGGIAPPHRTEHVTVADGEHRTLRRYADDEQVRAAREAGRTPILLVPPIAAPASCYDLSPEHSVVAHLRDAGRVPYVVDFGEVTYADRAMGFADFIADIIPQAIRRVIEDYGDDAGVVDLYGWSLGGTLSLLTTAAQPEGARHIRSVVTVGTPLDYDALPGYSLARALMKPTGGRVPTAALRLLGGIPSPAVKVAYRATSWDRELKKPWFVATHLGETDTLKRMEVIDRFQRDFPGYPGRLAEEMWESFIYRNELRVGQLRFDGLTVDLDAVDVPVQLFGSHRDALCSWDAARHGVTLLSGSPHVEFTTVESSHLGLLAGPDAVAHTWPAVDGFLTTVDALVEPGVVRA
ncbi:putative hydrolase [Gordonia araii NBRC 100433]|uniref:Putative hydrolase n=1 Tax=Gordonia araii NBRC 100433 TaxID=1073574 RepID=G7GY14_9ACTN|nr:alpha/beta hydrolase [Gordonia araii]NNG98100.1 alpha/beta hydrolase [Gordonia araii NBRC 100433]GAB08489.1 putative hydrolase [Gordonia araii NBRC 100433]